MNGVFFCNRKGMLCGGLLGERQKSKSKEKNLIEKAKRSDVSFFKKNKKFVTSLLIIRHETKSLVFTRCYILCIDLIM